MSISIIILDPSGFDDEDDEEVADDDGDDDDDDEEEEEEAEEDCFLAFSYCWAIESKGEESTTGWRGGEEDDKGFVPNKSWSILDCTSGCEDDEEESDDEDDEDEELLEAGIFIFVLGGAVKMTFGSPWAASKRTYNIDKSQQL